MGKWHENSGHMYTGVSKLALAVAQATVAVAPCVARRVAPFISKNEK